MNKENIDCYQYLENDQRLINQFYKQHKLNVSCNKLDHIFVASYSVNSESTIIAALIVRPYQTQQNDILLMRSIYVHDNHRKKGIAKILIKLAFKNIKHNIYLLCQGDLMSFYSSIGMLPTEDKTDVRYIEQQIKKGLCLLHRPYKN